MIILFSFALNLETKEATFAGSVDPQKALHILQDIVIAEVSRSINKEITNEVGKTSN